MITFAKFIDEARKFPHLNPKVSVNQAIADHLASAPVIPGTTLKNSFTSFTTVDKLGINPQSKYNTPLGIYAYQNDYSIQKMGVNRLAVALPFAGDSPYANIFSVKGNIVHLNTMDSIEANSYYKKMIEYYLNTLKIRRGGTEWKTEVDKIEEFINDASSSSRFPRLAGGQFWYVSMKIKDLLAERTNRKAHIIWNSLFRGIGIDGFIDTGKGIIHIAEPSQAVFFSIDSIVKNKRVDNKYSPDTIKSRVHYGLTMRDHVKELQALANDDERKEYVMNNPVAYKFLKNPSKDFERSFYDKQGIQHIKNPSEEIQLDLVSGYGPTIEYIKNPSEKVQLAAVNNNGFAIEHIKNPSEKVQLAAIKYKPSTIQYIKNPSEKVQLAAVSDNNYSFTIEHIKNPTEKVQLVSVNNSPYSIKYIENPTEKVQLVVVNKSPHLIEHIKNPTEKVQLAAVENEPSIIYLIKNPSEKVQLAAVNKNSHSYTNIKNPTPKVTALAKSLGVSI